MPCNQNMWVPSRGQPVILVVSAGRLTSPTQTTPNTTSLHPTMLTWWLLTLSLTVQLTLTSPAIREEETSPFQNAVQHCCTTTTTTTPHRYFQKASLSPVSSFLFRCFEVNEFAGVNFVRSPCRFLKSVEKKTQMDPEDKLIETRQRKKNRMVSKFQTAVQNCCDNVKSKAPYRWKSSYMNWLTIQLSDVSRSTKFLESTSLSSHASFFTS